MADLPENLLALLNAHVTGFDAAMGLRFVAATADELVAELAVGERHLQPHGLVHGGVHAGLIEALCSTGAALGVMASGGSAVGLENTTSFLRAARGGVLRCVARPVHRGRSSQVWTADVLDENGRLLATGRVRLQVLAPGAKAAGEVIALGAAREGRREK